MPGLPGMDSRLSAPQARLGEAYAAVQTFSWMGDNMRAAQAEARIEYQADPYQVDKKLVAAPGVKPTFAELEEDELDEGDNTEQERNLRPSGCTRSVC